jgi:SAM-dependent methyltransferase
MNKDQFPISAGYDLNWARKFSIGSNTLYSTEFLLEQLPEKKFRRILDLGSGYALSSIMLSKVLDADVWAIDKYISDIKVQALLNKANATRVFPLKLSATSLSFPLKYFDAIVCINAYSYFGTDDKFLPYITAFLKPGGILAITDISVTKEVASVKGIPALLKKDFFYYWQHVHSSKWWKNKFEKSGLVDILKYGHSERSALLKNEYLSIAKIKGWDAFSTAFKNDRNNTIDYFYLVAEKNQLKPFLETY